MSEATKSYYDKLAEIYDEAFAKYDVNGEFSIELRKIANPVTSALDLGCGTGETVKALRSRFPSLDITAVDISQNMVAKAKEKCSDVNH